VRPEEEEEEEGDVDHGNGTLPLRFAKSILSHAARTEPGQKCSTKGEETPARAPKASRDSLELFLRQVVVRVMRYEREARGRREEERNASR